MMFVRAAAAAALLACGATLAFAQTAPSKDQPGAPEQSKQAPTEPGAATPLPSPAAKSKGEAGAPTQSSQPSEGAGSRAIGPPADPAAAPGTTKDTKEEKKKSPN